MSKENEVWIFFLLQNSHSHARPSPIPPRFHFFLYTINIAYIWKCFRRRELRAKMKVKWEWERVRRAGRPEGGRRRFVLISVVEEREASTRGGCFWGWEKVFFSVVCLARRLLTLSRVDAIKDHHKVDCYWGFFLLSYLYRFICLRLNKNQLTGGLIFAQFTQRLVVVVASLALVLRESVWRS